MDKYFRSSELSDIDIIYTVQQHQPQPLPAARRSKRAKTHNAATCFPGHKLCLSSHSSVMRTEIETGATVVELLLESADDIPAADAMLALMYQVPDALAGLQQTTLLRTALLANKYNAQGPLDAAIERLQKQSLDDAALQLFWQVPACWEPPFWDFLLEAIDYRLSSSTVPPGHSSTAAGRMDDVRELLVFVCGYDLESVWTQPCDELREILMEVPVSVLAELLSCEHLRVLSEDTVLLTVAKRIAHLKQLGEPEAEVKQEISQLMEAVRLPRCTPAALAFIAPKLPWTSQQQCTTAAFLRACEVSSSSQDSFKVPAVWWAAPHASSPKESHTMEFSCDLSQLKTALGVALASPPSKRPGQVWAKCSDGNNIFGGREWGLCWHIHRVEGGVEAGCYVSVSFPFLSDKEVKALPWAAEGVEIRIGSKSYTVSSSGGGYSKRSRGVSNVFGTMRSAAEWAAPAWAQGNEVVVRMTVTPKNCL